MGKTRDKHNRRSRPVETVGWREWVNLPRLSLDHIKVKVDTGARTSALHAFFVEPYRERGVLHVRFGIHPVQLRTDVETICHAEVIDQREVMDSGGHREHRYFIVTEVAMGPHRFPVEMTLTNRDTMRFRMLLGRSALAGRFVVDPDASYLQGEPRTEGRRRQRTDPST